MITKVEELETLDFLLTEAEKSCTCRKGASLVVVMDIALVKLCSESRAAGVAPLCGEMSLRACLSKHGAVLYSASILGFEEEKTDKDGRVPR